MYTTTLICDNGIKPIAQLNSCRQPDRYFMGVPNQPGLKHLKSVITYLTDILNVVFSGTTSDSTEQIQPIQ